MQADAIRTRHRPTRDHGAAIAVLLLLAVTWPLALTVVAPVVLRSYVIWSLRALLSAFVGGCLIAGAAWPSSAADPARDLRVMSTGGFTAAALVWGLAHHGTVQRRDGLIVVTGMRDGYGWRRGLTVGQVFLTRDVEPDAAELRHERRHAVQWMLLGGALPGLYGWAEMLGHAAGGGPGGNLFEAAAGLEDGGYVPPPAARPFLATLLRLVGPHPRAETAGPAPRRPVRRPDTNSGIGCRTDRHATALPSSDQATAYGTTVRMDCTILIDGLGLSTSARWDGPGPLRRPRRLRAVHGFVRRAQGAWPRRAAWRAGAPTTKPP